MPFKASQGISRHPGTIYSRYATGIHRSCWCRQVLTGTTGATGATGPAGDRVRINTRNSLALSRGNDGPVWYFCTRYLLVATGADRRIYSRSCKVIQWSYDGTTGATAVPPVLLVPQGTYWGSHSRCYKVLQGDTMVLTGSHRFYRSSRTLQGTYWGSHSRCYKVLQGD